MYYRLTILIILLCAGVRSFGQVDSTFMEVEKAMQREFDAFAQENQQEFDKYVEEIDKEFSDYLRKNWEEFRLFAGIKPDTTPKPQVLPKFNPAIPKIKPGEVPKEIPVMPKSGIPQPNKQLVPNLPVILKSEPEEPVIEPEGKDEPEGKVEPEGKDEPVVKTEPVVITEPESKVEPAGKTQPERLTLPVVKVLPVVKILPVVKVLPVVKAEFQGKPMDFYGTKLSVNYDPGLAGTLPEEIHNTTIADFWDRINKTNYSGLIRMFNDTRTKMNLNDWGYYMLVKKTAELISPSTNYSRLLSWFLLTKSGYRVRVAYAENQIALMFPSSNTIYGLRYFMIDQVRFYAPEFKPNQIYTYEKDFPGASKPFDLNVYNALNIGDQFAERTFNLTYKNRECKFAIQYNLNSIAFYKDFPLCELSVTFDATPTAKSKESILEALKPQLNGLSAADAVDFLLNFVQNGFPYKTDQDQFNGEEKFFFPEEDFYYPYTDCDDRAVFFAYLVKELLGFKVVGVVYPGHVATAIRFPSDESGDYIMLKGEKYVIADPTYINAPFGLTMPGMVNAKAEIIELVNEQNREEKLTSVWEKAETGGGLKGDNRQNYCVDADGNLYLTGYFQGKATFGGTTLSSSNGKKDAFLAKYNAAGNPVWAVAGGSDGTSMGYNISLDPKGNMYVCGTFEKTIAFGRVMTMANASTCIFVAKFDGDGRMVWLNQIKQDTATGTGDYIFSSSYTSAGKLLSTKQYPMDVNFTDWGLSFDGEENVYYTGSFNATAGMKIDRLALNLETSFNIIASLKEEIDKQIASNCEQTISGLFGALTLIKHNNVNLSGREIQEAFEKYNPRFKEVAPMVFERIGKLNMIKNDEGIVTITTREGKPVVIDKLKIQNNTRLKVIPLPTGDARIEILNGIKVGKAFIWFSLNYVRLFRTNGNVLFDYDSDHSQITLNMKKDILM